MDNETIFIGMGENADWLRDLSAFAGEDRIRAPKIAEEHEARAQEPEEAVDSQE